MTLSKIALIVFFIIAGLVLDLGGFSGQERIGFRFWKEPYPLFHEYIATGSIGRFLGFWSTMIYAAFAYGNVQVVAIAGAETRNPRKSIPKALKRTFFRVVAFYVASIFVISLTVPANDERLQLTTGNASQSPFVIAFSRAGVKVSCPVHSTTKFLFQIDNRVSHRPSMQLYIVLCSPYSSSLRCV